MPSALVEGGEAFDELAQLHGRHDDADALGFLHDEVFENEVLDELLLELHRLEAGRIEIGILGAHLLLKLFVFPLELLNGDGSPFTVRMTVEGPPVRPPTPQKTKTRMMMPKAI